MSHHLVEAEDLKYSYPDGHTALNGVSFRITHGESVAIVGANGAGKSTLLLHLNGCLVPEGGTVRIGDFPLTKQTLPQVRRTVGMVFQDPDDQLFMPQVYDDVAFGPLNLGLPAAEVDRRVMNALETVGAAHLKDRPPYKLSAGEKRSVAIASVLSMSPSILVMDEPTSNLDPKTRRQLIELLKTFSHTIIIATHDLDMVLDLCSRTLVLKQGRIVSDGPTWDIMQDQALLEASSLEKPLRLQGCPVCHPDPAPRLGGHGGGGPHDH
ncbi:MAG: energy-coupling factor ABC transporter ATP-binding protein [Syntrophobacterales bacterium]|jgi:cobalt/nickel transport system ATP-binding protein|nr:energy-coupling factor ABC transporter ATP-binding protein [Syntrophobacterales bacterium]